jgi:hypothetical protein
VSIWCFRRWYYPRPIISRVPPSSNPSAVSVSNLDSRKVLMELMVLRWRAVITLILLLLFTTLLWISPTISSPRVPESNHQACRSRTLSSSSSSQAQMQTTSAMSVLHYQTNSALLGTASLFGHHANSPSGFYTDARSER